jgi:hypothetical protein
MQSPEELLKTQANLIAAQKDILVAFDCIETSYYGLAWRDFMIATAVFAQAQKNGSPSDYQAAQKKMLSHQRVFIRAQVDLMMANNIYGE